MGNLLSAWIIEEFAASTFLVVLFVIFLFVSTKKSTIIKYMCCLMILSNLCTIIVYATRIPLDTC